MSAVLGENVTMECSTNAPVTRLDWVEVTDGNSRSTSIYRFPFTYNEKYDLHVQSDNITFWNLVIEDVSHDDEGIYACYVCTKTCIKWRYNLTVMKVFGKFSRTEQVCGFDNIYLDY